MLNNQYFPYQRIREGQQRIIDKVNQNKDKKYIIIEAGTGTGKSGLAITAAKSEMRGYIITDSIQLQNQYEADFGSMGLVNMKGKRNYRCIEKPACTCDVGPCSKCTRRPACHYYSQLALAQESPVFLTNYAYVMTAVSEKRPVMVFDEAHLLEKHLTSLCTLDICTTTIDKDYQLFSPSLKSEYVKPLAKFNGDYEDYLKALHRAVQSRIKAEQQEITRQIGIFGDQEDETLKNIFSTDTLYELRKIDTVVSHFVNLESSENDWLLEEDFEKNILKLRPLSVSWLFNEYIKCLADKFYFMSATILDHKLFCATLGIPEEETLFIREDSTFDPDKSPIYTVCNCPTSYQALQDEKNKALIAESVKNILKIYPNSKGIIHAGNMSIAKYLKYHINDPRLLVRMDDINNQEIYREHLKSSKPTVLVSSSMAEGVDLKDDLSRFQVVVKMPFDSLADPRVKKLSSLRSNWYQCEMFKKFIQQCGRSTRTEDDYCDTYVLDSSFKKWFAIADKNGWLTDQFKKRVRDLC